MRRRRRADLVEQIRASVAAEIRPVLKTVARTEHELAVLRQEIGYNQAHSEVTATRLTEHISLVDRKFDDVYRQLAEREDAASSDPSDSLT